jgi:hypothetical protein
MSYLKRYNSDSAIGVWRSARIRDACLLVLISALGISILGCSLPEPPSQRQAISCSLVRLDEAQILFLASRSNMVRYYKERNASALNAVYNFAGDAIARARATRNCRDFDKSVRAVAVNLIRMSTQMRILAISTMRDPDSQTAVTLMQEQYGEAFAGRDIE